MLTKTEALARLEGKKVRQALVGLEQTDKAMVKGLAIAQVVKLKRYRYNKGLKKFV